MREIDEESDFDDIKKSGKRREMRDIDEESDFEDIKKREREEEMRDIEEDIDFEDIKRSGKERMKVLLKIVKLKTSKRGKGMER